MDEWRWSAARPAAWVRRLRCAWPRKAPPSSRSTSTAKARPPRPRRSAEDRWQCNATSAIRVRSRNCSRWSPARRESWMFWSMSRPSCRSSNGMNSTFDEWRRVLRVNLDGLYLMCRAGSDLMRKSGYGRIVNFSSNSIFAGTPNMAHYVASKGGVLTFTRALATELGPYKITANSICPGLIDTEGVQETPHKDAFEIRRNAAGHQGPRRAYGRGAGGRIPRIGGGSLDHRPGAQRRCRHGALVAPTAGKVHSARCIQE